MAIWGDYHTHTVYSHGKGGIEDNVLRAVRAGLKEIAITDHGFNHMTYNVRRKDIPEMRAEIETLKVKYPQIKVYLGVEANITSVNGRIDVRERDKPGLDIIVCGYHKLVFTSSFKAPFTFFLSNNLGFKGRRTVARNTDAYINALEKNEIDILSHPGNFCKCDIGEVAKACKHFGTYFELNSKRMLISDAELEAAAKQDCEFILSSDAHRPRRVGKTEDALMRALRVGIPYERIANYNRLPVFRSRRIKKDG